MNCCYEISLFPSAECLTNPVSSKLILMASFADFKVLVMGINWSVWWCKLMAKLLVRWTDAPIIASEKQGQDLRIGAYRVLSTTAQIYKITKVVTTNLQYQLHKRMVHIKLISFGVDGHICKWCHANVYKNKKRAAHLKVLNQFHLC